MKVFRNQGILDLASIVTFGVSVKTEGTPIGFFGTGLKYAIAILLREGCAIGIRTHQGADVHVYAFGLEEIQVRGVPFQCVTLNGQHLAFTTEYGKTWELWQAARELYSNCLDERGEVVDYSVDDYQGTQVIVSGEAFEAVWQERHAFLLDTTPVYATESLEIHMGASEFVYYQGIRVLTLNPPSMFTYNLLNRQALTEDRTLASWWLSTIDIRDGLSTCTDASIVDAVLCAPPDTVEAELDYNYSTLGEVFADRVLHHLRKGTTCLNPTVTKGALKRTLSCQEVTDITGSLSEEDSTVIMDAMELVMLAGFDVSIFTVSVVPGLGKDESSFAMGENIYLTRATLAKGTHTVACVLLEKYIECEKGLSTQSKAMQEFLLSTVIQLAEKR